jgi:Ca-activated chloride channel family protein
VGLVSFDRLARVVASPSVDHQLVLDGIDRLILGTGTGTGEAIYTALDALTAANDTAGAAATPEGGSAIVLLSDGVPTVGRPVLGAAQEAADQGVPISTIAFGTDQGTVTVQGRRISVPADPETMATVAEMTNGKFFEAVSAKELRSVYKDIGTRVGYETEQRDASGPILTLAVFALIVASGLALIWNGRLV